MGSASKRKGSGFELEVVKVLQERGIAAEKVPLSGAVKSFSGKYEADIDCPVRGIDKKFECKRRKAGFKTLYGWLTRENNYAVVVRDDHCEALVVMRLTDFAELAR